MSRGELLPLSGARGSRAGEREGILLRKKATQLKHYCPVEVAAVVDAELSSVAADEEEAADGEAADVAVLVAETTTGVEDAMAAAAVVEAEVVVDPSGVPEAVAAVFGRGEVVDAADLSATAA